MKFKAFVSTKTVGSQCGTEFEIPDEDLHGKSDDEREALIQEGAESAIYGMDLVQIWWEEA